jgi:hypothetical protein
MPLQNRVDPWGNLHAHPARSSTMMGNRGILHDAEKRVVKHWVGKSWIACDPSYKKIDRRPLFQVGRYSELFFLDEATAFAAGHRPCAYCQRERFNEFKAAWTTTHLGNEPVQSLSIKEIDARLHQDRVTRDGKRVMFTAVLEDLPEGTIFEFNRVAILLHRGRQYRWAFEGYALAEPVPKATTVSVITPKCIVQLLGSRMRPRVHASADA